MLPSLAFFTGFGGALANGLPVAPTDRVMIVYLATSAQETPAPWSVPPLTVGQGSGRLVIGEHFVFGQHPLDRSVAGALEFIQEIAGRLPVVPEREQEIDRLVAERTAGRAVRRIPRVKLDPV